MENLNVLCKLDGIITVEIAKSKKTGNDYKAVYLTINGVKVQLGFYNVYLENALLRAGVKVGD